MIKGVEKVKSVLLSIKPEYCKLIASGQKTIEVRKTRPRIETPFKCYIYCTKDNTDICPKRIWWKADETGFQHIMNGKVIGEFMCDTIFPIAITYSDIKSRIALKEFPFTGLTDKQILDYLGNGKQGYGWHISDLKIYDRPKKLSEYSNRSSVFTFSKSGNLVYTGMTRPPQSWCYVEDKI